MNHDFRLSNIEMQLSERTVELQRACIELADSKARSHAMADLTNELNNKLLRVENDVQRKVEDIQTLQMDLAETRSRVDGLVSQNESLSSENGALKQKIDRTESMLATKGNEVDQYKDRLHECMAQLRVLQERFEDQSITLRITKESNGDLQERLINAEATYARNLESSTNALNMDLRVFQEQKAHAEALLVDAKAELHRLHENTARRLVDVQAETHKTQESIELKLQTESDRARQADQNLIEAIKTQQTLREEFHVLELRYEKLAREAEHAKQISLEHEKTAKDLKTQIQLLGASKAELEERAERIGDRYITGDLSEEEKAFIGNLTRTAESSYEQELIARGNELRKGEIALKALQARNKLLESTLARHLNSQARAQAQTGNESRSMIDLDEWLSSQLSSSPAQVPQHVTIAKAPDRDSTNNDDAATNGRPTPAPRRADLRPLATSPVANVHRYHGPPPGAAGRYTPGLKKTAMPPPVCTMPKTTAADRPLIGTANTSMIPATHQTVGLNKTTFTSLATNGSDDIVDFDDDRRVSPVVSVDKALTPKAGKGKASDTVTKRDFSPLEGSLGKRSREGEASPIDAGAGRSNRRAKVAMRKSVRQNGDGDKRKATETLAAPRAKTRKRR
ncbi:hypothetical protein NEOLEDRAFT_874301 [Neolentinus lepideus HHB14362 ss-1]|uniref:Uncharacterized protein n=1 Tax=Neolentinus lepideus HHB14362 ss-1 TaxID=1314782 RepID=A0A165P156_9AGAM|nr:hypothetical protein NEOLEDRAFT_874301 [Neolentinus lepideus HHB14362 ss-1]